MINFDSFVFTALKTFMTNMILECTTCEFSQEQYLARLRNYLDNLMKLKDAQVIREERIMLMFEELFECSNPYNFRPHFEIFKDFLINKLNIIQIR